eukprot:COSAG01_NODE_4044_length_5408_cov_1.746468_7_plen_167_part_00
MIPRKQIETGLKNLDQLYNTSMAGADPTEPIYYSKLAVLELTGWIEESFDIIAYRAIKNELTTVKFSNIAQDAVKKNSGFNFDNNFLTMLQKLIGVVECERLHEYLDSDGTLARLRAELNAVFKQRCKAAHVNIARTTVAFDAPSVSLGRLRIVYPILREMYSYFC